MYDDKLIALIWPSHIGRKLAQHCIPFTGTFMSFRIFTLTLISKILNIKNITFEDYF